MRTSFGRLKNEKRAADPKIRSPISRPFGPLLKPSRRMFLVTGGPKPTLHAFLVALRQSEGECC